MVPPGGGVLNISYQREVVNQTQNNLDIKSFSWYPWRRTLVSAAAEQVFGWFSRWFARGCVVQPGPNFSLTAVSAWAQFRHHQEVPRLTLWCSAADRSDLRLEASRRRCENWFFIAAVTRIHWPVCSVSPVYTLFAFIEYLMVFSNIAFHFTAFWDFGSKELIVATPLIRHWAPPREFFFYRCF